MNQDMADKIEFVFNDSTAKCDLRGCDGKKDLRLVKLKGRFDSFLICKDCLLSVTQLLMMNEGV